jgi:hypothetical protein
MHGNAGASASETCAQDGARSTEPTQSFRENAAVYCILGLFAVALAAVTRTHEMYLNEAQVWLMARHSHNLVELFQHLRYEGHPAVWYLLNFLPSHLTTNLIWMQVINYLLSLVTAWLILSERRIPILVRVLIVFSVFLFFYMGVASRSYMLAGMLLIASARCLLADRPRHWLAMVLLGLAINTHFLAIPVVAAIFVWFYWLEPAGTLNDANKKLSERRFWISLLVLGVALVFCYLTVRPASDLYTPHYDKTGVTFLDLLLMNVGSVWRYVLIFPAPLRTPQIQELVAPENHPSGIAVALTLALWMVAISGLPTSRSKKFFIAISLMWTVATWATVHIPAGVHVSFLFVGYVIALMMALPENRNQSGKTRKFARSVPIILLGVQVVMCTARCLKERDFPFSGGKSTAMWLKGAGLADRPLVIQPDLAGPAILAYAGIESAYYPACLCRGSFVVFRQGRDVLRHVGLEELQAIQKEFGSAPVVISKWKLAQEETRRLGLRLEYESPGGWSWVEEDVFVYETVGQTSSGN